MQDCLEEQNILTYCLNYRELLKNVNYSDVLLISKGKRRYFNLNLFHRIIHNVQISEQILRKLNGGCPFC